MKNLFKKNATLFIMTLIILPNKCFTCNQINSCTTLPKIESCDSNTSSHKIIENDPPNMASGCLEIKWISDYSYRSLFQTQSSLESKVDQVLNKVEDIFRNNTICIDIINNGPLKVFDIYDDDPFKDFTTNLEASQQIIEESMNDPDPTDITLLFTALELQNHGATWPNSICSDLSVAFGLAKPIGGTTLFDVDDYAQIMAHEIVHILTDNEHNNACSGLMDSRTPFQNTNQKIMPQKINQINQALINNSCTSCINGPAPCPQIAYCNDNMEPNNAYSEAANITVSQSNTILQNLCINQSDSDVFTFIYNDKEIFITVTLKECGDEDRSYNLSYFLIGGTLTVETQFSSGPTPPDTELRLSGRFNNDIINIRYDDNSGSNPPLSKIVVDLESIINFTTINTDLAFTCESGCESNVIIVCGALGAVEEYGTIVISNLQVTNTNNFDIHDIKIQYSLVGEGGEFILEAFFAEGLIIETLPKNSTITAPGPLINTPTDLIGTYELKASLPDFNISCQSSNSWFLGNIETCFDGIWNQNESNVDCGGYCEPCETCYDGIQNQGEDQIDCGGPCEECETCHENLILTQINDGAIYNANNTITGIGPITQSVGDVNFNAGRKVSLLTGFVADATEGSYFEAIIQNCNEN